MPLDDTTKHYEQALAPSPADPLDYRTFTPGPGGLRKLAWVLRHPGVWPPGHTWDYNKTIVRHQCDTFGCAMGVAQLMWPAHIDDTNVMEMSDKFNMPLGDANAIFYDPFTYDKHWTDVTALDVASAIDSYLARAEALAKSEAGGTP